MGNRFPEWAAGRLKVQKEAGAQGLKIWKPFGLHVKDDQEQLVKVDDARLNPIWETAGELGLPVLIHVADPVAFFDPIDETNERWEELGEHPDWAFTSPPFPPFMEIMNAFKNLVMRHSSYYFYRRTCGMLWRESLAGWDRCSRIAQTITLIFRRGSGNWGDSLTPPENFSSNIRTAFCLVRI